MALIKRPPISVVMTTYNGGLWIEEQLRSILVQLNDDDEVIICDDISDDFTRVIIERFGDSRITLHVNTHQLGAWENVKQALELATKEIIFISDQDDIWLENKVVTVLAEFSEKIDLVMHDAVVIDAEKNVLHESYFAERSVKHGVLYNALHNSYTGCFCACKKSLIDHAKPFPEFTPYDQWLGLIAEKRKSAQHSTKPLVQWRRHSSNVTTPFGAIRLTNLLTKIATIVAIALRRATRS